MGKGDDDEKFVLLANTKNDIGGEGETAGAEEGREEIARNRCSRKLEAKLPGEQLQGKH